MKTRYWYWIWKTFLGPSRLRKKFVRIFLLAGLLPLVLMGVVSVYLVNLTHDIDVQTLEDNVAKQASLVVSKVIDKGVADLALTVTYEDLAPIRADQQDTLLSGIMKANENFLDLSLICTISEFCKIGTETRSWMSLNSQLVLSSDLKDLAVQPSFLSALGGKTYISPIEFSNNDFRITIAAPIFNSKSQVISVLMGKLSLSQLGKSLDGLKLGDTGYIYVVSSDLRVIASSNSKFINTEVGNNPLISQILKNKEDNLYKGVYYEGLIGQRVSGAGVFIKNLNWMVVAEWPSSETQSLIRTIFIQISIFFLVTLVIIVVFASYVALKLIEPIAEIRQGTSIIGGGNFNYRVVVKTGDELEDLGSNLNKMAESLKGLEEVRDLRLRTQYLSESLRKEQEVSKLKDQFITTVTHQFNTPLSVINWAVEGLKDQDLTKDKISDTIQIITKSQKDIVAIVSDLVTLSEIGFNYKKEKDKPTDIFELIKRISDSFQNSLRVKDIKINLTRSIDNAVATVNEFTLKKVFENLIDNAIGYSNNGSQIEVGVAGDDKKILVKVKDAGIGIPEANKEMIFQQFYRAKNAVVKKNVGTGLGLFITKSIVEGHGGKIWFESKEGVGTTFFVELPRK